MKKIILYSITSLINLSLVIVCIILGIVFKFDHRYFLLYLGTSIFLGIFNLIMIMLMEILIMEYKYKKFSLIMHSTYAVISTAFYYIYKINNKLSFNKSHDKLDNYYKYQYLYVLIPIILTIVCIIIFEVLNKIKFKEKEMKFDPKKYRESQFDPEKYLDKKYGLKEDEDDKHKFLNKK